MGAHRTKSPEFGPDVTVLEETFATLTPDVLLLGIAYGGTAIDSRQFEIVDDMFVARRLATDESVVVDGYTSWGFFKATSEEAIRNDSRERKALDRAVVSELSRLASNLKRRLELKLSVVDDGAVDWFRRPELRSLVCRNIQEDVELITRSHLVFGNRRQPFETMFSAYKQGGWPCGWRGKYPDGKMVVYHIGPKI